MTPPASARSDGTADAPRVPPPIDPTNAQPPFDPRAVDELPWRTSVLPRLPEPADRTPLAADPVTRAVTAAANEFDEEFDISELGDDGRWRAVDTSGLDPDAAPRGDVVGMTSSSLSPDGAVVQTYHSKATSHELRRYEAGQLTHRVSPFPDGVDQYGILTGLSADDAVAAIREWTSSCRSRPRSSTEPYRVSTRNV